jgi:hypothetical protein
VLLELILDADTVAVNRRESSAASADAVTQLANAGYG